MLGCSTHLKIFFLIFLQVLFQHFNFSQATPVISFHTAAASGNVDQIHELLESGIEVNGRNSVSYLYQEVV